MYSKSLIIFLYLHLPRREREHNDRYRDDYRPRRRSGSPYHNRSNNYRSDRRRRYERSRSRSYSPRMYINYKILYNLLNVFFLFTGRARY